MCKISIFKIFQKIANDEERKLKDRKDRTVQEINTTFTTVLGEKVTYTSYCKLNCLLRGLDRFMESELLEDAITVRGVTYNPKHIVSIESKIIRDRLVKKEVKEKDWDWEYRRYFSEDELVEDEEMFPNIKKFNSMTQFKEENFLDVLKGYKLTEVIQNDENVLKSKFKNQDGEEKIITQTKDSINITWDVK